MLAHLITHELGDARLAASMVSVSRAKVSPDLSVLDVWIAILAERGQQEGLFGVVRHALPFLRRRLGEELGLRVVPKLRMRLDETPDQAARVEHLLEVLEAERAERRRLGLLEEPGPADPDEAAAVRDPEDGTDLLSGGDREDDDPPESGDPSR